jgi:quercetin dioxygenase-like cupin family protein
MSLTRIFNSSDFLQPADGEPIRSVIVESKDAAVVAWYVNPGQEIVPHFHPNGQDTWMILSGSGKYYLDQTGTIAAIAAGNVVIAPLGCVHGVFNDGEEPLIFISVVSPTNAGYQQISLDETASLDT